MRQDLEGARGRQGGEAQSVQSEEGWLSSAVRKCSKLGNAAAAGRRTQRQVSEGIYSVSCNIYDLTPFVAVCAAPVAFAAVVAGRQARALKGKGKVKEGAE